MSDTAQLREHVLSIVKDIENGLTIKRGGDYEHLLEEGYENGDTMSGFDYLTDVLDIEYIIGSDKQYLGARILVCFGGPNIWINTRAQCVEGYWWGQSFTKSYHRDVMGVDDAVSELWNVR